MSICLLSSVAASVADASEKTTKNSFGRDYVEFHVDPVMLDYVNTIVANIDGKFFNAPVKVKHSDPYKSYKMFCYGAEAAYPDIVAGPRPMDKTEFERCQKRDLGEIVQLKLGYDAIVLATDKTGPKPALNSKELFMALAEDVPAAEKNMPFRLIANPYQRWNQVNAEAPDKPIKVLGPVDETQLAYSVRDLAMEKGCRSWDWVVDMKYIQKSAALYRALCYNIREDGRYVKAKKDDDSIQTRLRADKGSVGFVGFNAWKKDSKGLKALTVDDIPPSMKTISAELYPLSRPLYVYIKVASLENVQGVAYLLTEMTSDKALGPDGYLARKGMVAMTDKERKIEAEHAKKLKPLKTVQ